MNTMIDYNEIIIRYLDSSATKEEKENLFIWLKSSGTNRIYFYEIRDIWLSCNAQFGDDIDTEIALERFKERIQSVPQPQQSTFLKRKVPVSSLLWLAACFVALISVSYGVFFQQTRNNAIIKEVITNHLLTAEGSKGRYLLPDSTVVWLNGNSSLRFPENFNDGNREVYLDGEAYFEVKKAGDSEFLVHAGAQDIRVLGTKFLIQNYAQRNEIHTVLVEGKVEVKNVNLEEPNILEPNQIIRFTNENLPAVVENVDPSFYIGWINDKLIFDNDRLSDIVVSLEKWYGIEFICSNPQACLQRISFTVQKEPVDEILKALRLVAHVNYSIKNNKIYLTTKNIPNLNP